MTAPPRGTSHIEGQPWPVWIPHGHSLCARRRRHDTSGRDARCRRFHRAPASRRRGATRLDGNPLNDHPENLAYGTAEEVDADHAARARREEAAGRRPTVPKATASQTPGLAAGASVTVRRVGLPGRPSRHAVSSPLHGLRCGSRAESGRRAVVQAVRAVPGRGKRERTRRNMAKSQKSARYSVCMDCGSSIANTGPGPLAKRCNVCRKLAQREADRRYRVRQAQVKRLAVVCRR